jgi:hypothetical protein
MAPWPAGIGFSWGKGTLTRATAGGKISNLLRQHPEAPPSGSRQRLDLAVKPSLFMPPCSARTMPAHPDVPNANDAREGATPRSGRAQPSRRR